MNIAREPITILKNRLEALEINVSQGRDGFTVCTEEEPFFCFVRKSIEEVNEVVEDTLKSYIRSFYECDSVEVRAVSVPIEESAVPIEHLKPFSKIRPTVGAS